MTALVLLGVFVFCGVVGFLDDLLKVRRRNSDGLSAKGKLLGQAIVAAGSASPRSMWPAPTARPWPASTSRSSATSAG